MKEGQQPKNYWKSLKITRNIGDLGTNPLLKIGGNTHWKHSRKMKTQLKSSTKKKVDDIDDDSLHSNRMS